MPKTARIHNLANVRRDRGYRFQDRDPDMDWICRAITDSERSVGEIVDLISKTTGGAYRVGRSTITNWLSGKTRRPQNFTMTWVAHALGYERRWVKL